ncbi:MAG: DNA topoisomerase, partial [Bacteroidales bacterium]|nr:DNA topoisomerase [Bacteroidales bacterium]
TNISKVALAMAKEAITQEYGETYVKLRQYTTKVKGAQEAHEAIRPTNLKAATVLAESAQKRLYELIWKRTIASQMADAELEKTVVTIEADGTTASFESKGERVLFDGFIKVYTESYDDEEENGEEQHMLPNVKRGDKVVLQKATAVQAYTQHPPRYTEASLVRKLEELGIGRPSTYAPTVSTILKREYVDKQDLEPRVQQAVLLTLNGDGALTREVREEKTGLEKNKLVPTDIGVLVNQFLMEHFPEIIDYNFTADVEKDFDEIARGKKDWRNVIAHFYEPFHKNVEVTQQTSKRTSGERLLGIDPKSGKNVYAKVGRFGPLIQIGDTKAEEKPRFASMKRGQSISTITLDEALDLFALPRTVGEWEGKPVVVSVGRFGPYVKYDNAYYSLGKNDDPYAVELQRCQEIIAEKRAANEDKERLKKLLPKELGKFENETIVVNIGKYGPYLVYKQANYRLPKTLKDPTTLRLEEAIEVIRSHAGKKPTKERARKKQ